MAHTASDAPSGASPPRRRRWRAQVIALVGAALTAIGGSAWAYLSNKTAEEIEGGIDARRLSVDYSVPADNCTASVGWSDPAHIVQEVASGEATMDSILDETLTLGQYALVRIHFTLPRIADLATIDVRSVNIRLSPGNPQPPQWALSLEGCGAAEYNRQYLVAVRDGRAHTQILTEDGESLQKPFEPFMVEPGETVFLDYNITVCDPASYELVFTISYVSDSGHEEKLRIPQRDAFMLTALPPQTMFLYDGREVLEYPQPVPLEC
jgi:hypothetical protein